MQTLDKPWQDWIRSNLARGCTHDVMLRDMVHAGVSEQAAVFNLAVFSQTGGSSSATLAAQSAMMAAKPSNPQSALAVDTVFKQEASHLFQYENTLIRGRWQVSTAF